MNLEEYVKLLDPTIVRVKKTSAGFIIEANVHGKDPNYASELYPSIFDKIINDTDSIIYSFYAFKNDSDRFVMDGSLKQIPTERIFDMPLSTFGANDIYGKFTKFDFDVLTLANRDKDAAVLFKIDEISPCKEPLLSYKELEMGGHQFLIDAKAFKVSTDIFSISVSPGINF